MNNENVVANTTDGEITTSTTSNITLCENISRSIRNKQFHLNDETVQSRLEEISEYMKQYSKSALS